VNLHEGLKGREGDGSEPVGVRLPLRAGVRKGRAAQMKGTPVMRGPRRLNDAALCEAKLLLESSGAFGGT